MMFGRKEIAELKTKLAAKTVLSDRLEEELKFVKDHSENVIKLLDNRLDQAKESYEAQNRINQETMKRNRKLELKIAQLETLLDQK